MNDHGDSLHGYKVLRLYSHCALSAVDLRDRTCHPGLDEMIKSFAGSGLMHLGMSLDEGMCSDIGRPDLMPGPPGSRPITMRIAQQNAMEAQVRTVIIVCGSSLSESFRCYIL